MRLLIMVLFLCVCCRAVQAQNLLANGSFEEENICTEYTMNCAPEAWICTSLVSDYYVYEPAVAFDGTHFVGLITGTRDKEGVRSFVRTRLLCGLRKGKQYQLNFYLCSRHNALDSVGVYFSATDFLFDTRPYSSITPALVIRERYVNRDGAALHWKEFSLVYTATGEEVFFTIGSFKKQEYRYTMPPDRQRSYYIYLDKISLTPVDANEVLCADADSIKALLYKENERHSLLDKKRYVYSRHPPPQEPRPATTIIRRIDTLIIPDILFKTASAKLDGRSYLVLDSFIKAITLREIDSLVFEGHTDSIGTLAYNQQLSADRAQSVAGYLLNRLALPAAKSVVRQYAYSRPLDTNATTAGRRRNRRVEIYLYTHE